MGSSAGGIIALAISTGIPDYELQKICYTMNAIPKNDRFYEGKIVKVEEQIVVDPKKAQQKNQEK